MFAARIKGRAWWWISLIVFVFGQIAAVAIYGSHLSRWLLRPNATATFWSIILAVACLSFFISMSIRRAEEIGAKPKLLLLSLLVLPIPFWIVALGLLPTKAEAAPAPFGKFVGRVRIGVVVSLCLVALGGSIYWSKFSQATQFETQDVVQPAIPEPVDTRVTTVDKKPTVSCIGTGNDTHQDVVCFSSSP